VDAAPQLQELGLVTEFSFGPAQLACLAGLLSLGSLELRVTAGAAPVVRSLTALQGLTHLALEIDKDTDGLLAAVGQLTGLVSLRILWMSWNRGMPLQPLAELQQLTSFSLEGCIIYEQQALVLAGLGQLRRLKADFKSTAAGAAARVARLEECNANTSDGAEMELQTDVLVQAPGHLHTHAARWAGFELSSVHTLQLEVHHPYKGQVICQQLLSRCPQLRALRLDLASFQPEALQAIAALPQLQHLCLYSGPRSPHLGCGSLAVLAGCSRQLRQLTLGGVGHLAERTLVALMAGLPQLLLLRLLGCRGALSQERCQALVGRLQLYGLQVDVVVNDGSGRAEWMITGLEERWREA
jgi:hypothetical protein